MDELRERVARVEQLVGQIEETADPATWSRVEEVVRTLMEVHAEGLRRLLARWPSPQGEGAPALRSVVEDDLVSCLLLLHGLHPEGLEVRVRKALDGVRPYLASHGGNVELIGVDDGAVVRLRLEGSCQGCPSSAATLRGTIEEAVLAAAPDVAGIEVAGTPSPAGGAA
jgi:Fe-S cluster biogenesis protein NfuA